MMPHGPVNSPEEVPAAAVTGSGSGASDPGWPAAFLRLRQPVKEPVLTALLGALTAVCGPAVRVRGEAGWLDFYDLNPAPEATD